MAETGRTDPVFWSVGSSGIADLGKETGKQRNGSGGSIFRYRNRTAGQYRAVLWQIKEKRAGSNAGTSGRISAADCGATWYFQPYCGLSHLWGGQSDYSTAKRRGKCRNSIAACYLEDKRGDHRTESVCKYNDT